MGSGAPIDVHVNGLAGWPRFAALEGRIRAAARAALAEGPPAGGPSPTEGEVSITVLPDPEIHELNRTYLGHDHPTDVLAFDLCDAPAAVLLGDVYVSADAALRQAEERGLAAEEEMLRLVIHGVLHLLGHDHPPGADREASPMFRLQEELLGRI